jgi:hypothetical protein
LVLSAPNSIDSVFCIIMCKPQHSYHLCFSLFTEGPMEVVDFLVCKAQPDNIDSAFCLFLCTAKNGLVCKAQPNGIDCAFSLFLCTTQDLSVCRLILRFASFCAPPRVDLPALHNRIGCKLLLPFLCATRIDHHLCSLCSPTGILDIRNFVAHHCQTIRDFSFLFFAFLSTPYQRIGLCSEVTCKRNCINMQFTLHTNRDIFCASG